MKSTDRNHLLYIEPLLEDKSDKPQDDCITEFMQKLWDDTKAKGLYGAHRGFHTACDDTKWNGVIHIYGDKSRETIETHAACVHYVRWFRDAIPSSDWQKLINIYTQLDKDDAALYAALQVELAIAMEREESQLATALKDVSEMLFTQSGEDFMSNLLSDMPTYEA